MTDKLIEQIKADSEAGTPGVWEVTYERGCTHLMMRDHPDMESQMCDETYYPWVPENDSDWHRIARVPDMEARILADAEVIKAAEDLAECLQYADRRIAWEAHGLGNGFAERAEASLTAFRQAQQARAEKGGE